MCEFEGALRASSRIDNESLLSSDGPEPRETGLALFSEDLGSKFEMGLRIDSGSCSIF